MSEPRRTGRASIRWRLTIWYSTMLGLSLIGFAVGSWLVLTRVLGSRHDRFLEEARGVYSSELLVEYREIGNLRLAADAAIRETSFSETWILVFDPEGRLLAKGNPRPETGAAIPPMVPATVDSIGRLAAASRGNALHTVGSDDAVFRVAVAPLRIGGGQLVVSAAQSRDSLIETMEQVTLSYLLIVPLALVASAIGGSIVARRALAPMKTMADRAHSISATNLHARLDVGEQRDEVSELAAVINQLLERLDRAFTLQRRFVADASHELRTPVATVCAEADVTLAVPSRPEREYRDSLTVVRDTSRRIAGIVDELFLLARIDAGHLPLASEPVYLSELADEVAKSLRTLAHARGTRIAMEADTDTALMGDSRLLQRMLLNLIDNAIKHSPVGGTVRVRTVTTAETAQVLVSDSGPGVPVEARDRVFDRFVRLEEAQPNKESATGGAGLGLSIARWIAEAHGGSLVIEGTGAVSTTDSGSTFVATLPRRS